MRCQPLCCQIKVFKIKKKISKCLNAQDKRSLKNQVYNCGLFLFFLHVTGTAAHYHTLTAPPAEVERWFSQINLIYKRIMQGLTTQNLSSCMCIFKFCELLTNFSKMANGWGHKNLSSWFSIQDICLIVSHNLSIACLLFIAYYGLIFHCISLLDI